MAISPKCVRNFVIEPNATNAHKNVAFGHEPFHFRGFFKEFGAPFYQREARKKEQLCKYFLHSQRYSSASYFYAQMVMIFNETITLRYDTFFFESIPISVNV